VRVVLAPDSFGDLNAATVATALAKGWSQAAPADDFGFAPLSDGGPGFVDVLARCFPQGDRTYCEVEGLAGEAIDVRLLRLGSTAYVESAAACGLDQLRRYGGDVRTTSTYGVGQLVAAAAAWQGIASVVVGLGGSGTNDGGAGLWAALGAEPAGLLRGGGVALQQLTQVTLPEFGAHLVAATDVDNPLLGFEGASAVYGPQKGADRAAIMSLDLGLEKWADAVEAATGVSGLRDQPGAGAAGGLGFGLLALGAERVSGVELVMDLVGLQSKIEGADLVVTGEGMFDSTSLRGKVVSGVAQTAQAAGVPCIVAAGQASVGGREASANGIDEVWSVADLLGSADAAIAAGPAGIEALGERLARSWSR
jgi:glycerate kinase